MKHSPQLDHPLRSYKEAQRDIQARETARVIELGGPAGKLLEIRQHIGKAEDLAKALRDEIPMDKDAYERAEDLRDFIDRDVIPDWLAPLETAVEEWLGEE